MQAKQGRSLGLLTSGGDAPGMNAAIRAIVRTALARGITPYAIYEGYQGMLEGKIAPMTWDSVGGILQLGGTIIGTARSKAFRTREGRKLAAYNLIQHNIDTLAVIGGDGSLTGANLFRQEWSSLLDELVQDGKIDAAVAAQHRALTIVGMVGSIDNDMSGTDMTIGTDTALHRIQQAIDAISSTAASHQRSFVVEVMGRHCGYLAVMSALATGAEYVLIPESPPEADNWEDVMCERLREGRLAGRRDNIVVVAEGACDRYGKPITSDYVCKALETRLGEDTRVTILGHVQRGGSPSAFDRNLSTIVGYTAIDYIASGQGHGEATLFGIRGNRVMRLPLMKCVEDTQAVGVAIKAQQFDEAMRLRGESFADALKILDALTRAHPTPAVVGAPRYRLAVMHAGAAAPGMNAAVRTAIRMGIDHGHTMLGVSGGFPGLIAGDIREFGWMDVNGWAIRGGADLGTSRYIPQGPDFYAIAKKLEENHIDGLLIIGGWAAYQGAYDLHRQRNIFPAFSLPIVCLPATIDNDLPGSELAIGSDTALNNITDAIDKIKQSAVATRRCFVVEVMGSYSGYLALMSGLATGAERVYLPEEGVKLSDLQADLSNLIHGFKRGKRLGLLIRNERVNELYTTEFIRALLEEEGKTLYDVRQAILGHLQQGGNPSPFDRIQATRMAARCIEYLIEQVQSPTPESAFVGMQQGKVGFTPVDDFLRMSDPVHPRPKAQWWLDLRAISNLLAQPGPES